MIRCESEYKSGMPNLSLIGLSENWLLKECGHQHWLALAKLMGKDKPDFRSRTGQPIYAAFVAVEVNNARLHLITENDSFRIVTSLVSVGRSRFFSQHRVIGKLGLLCSLGMISTLVTRNEVGNNQSVTRASLAGLSSLKDSDALTAGTELIRSAKSFKENRVDTWQGLKRLGDTTIPDYIFEPCPYSDFNGADFFYFANFQQVLDRAEWSVQKPLHRLWHTAHRQLNYYANINIGDQLRLVWVDSYQDKQSLQHWIQIYRVSDNRRIADVVTLKKRIDSGLYRWANITQQLAAIV